MKNFDLFNEFAEQVLGRPLNTVKPQWMSGWQVVEALWPLNEIFRPVIVRLRTIPYNPEFEVEADAAIALLASNANAWRSADLPAGALRVLLERQQQMLVVAAANEAAGNMRVMPIPPGFSESQRTVAAVLFFLHGMKLPQPPADRSGFEVPEGSAPESLRLH